MGTIWSSSPKAFEKFTLFYLRKWVTTLAMRRPSVTFWNVSIQPQSECRIFDICCLFRQRQIGIFRRYLRLSQRTPICMNE
jgi:hypothetical protein